MNQQQLSDFDSEQADIYTIRNINDFSDEQQGLTAQTSDYVTPEQSMLKGEKLTATQLKKKPYARIIGVGLVLLVMVFVLSFWRAYPRAVHDQPSSISVAQKSVPVSDLPIIQSVPISNFSGTYTFTVTGYPQIFVKNMNQPVHINVGTDNKITVTETARHSELENLHLNLINASQVEVMDSNSDDPNPPDLSGELDITVPAHVDVVVSDNVGTANVSPHNIFINGVTGQVQADTGYGDIQLQQTHLTGSSTLEAYQGNILFAGTLDPDSTTSMTAYNSVDVTLPSDAAFNLWASSKLTKNDFQSNVVGNAPQPSLSLEADNGSITIQKADS